jgi:single-strand DNA-binding protein
MNSIQLLGRTTNDPEKRFTPGGTGITSLRLAVNGARREDTTLFIDVIAFGKLGDAICDHVSKGRELGVTGRLSYRQWEHEGQRRERYEVVVTAVDFLRSAGGASGSGPDSAEADEAA